MELLGNANWWFPKWLDRIVPHLDVDAPATPDRATPDPAAQPGPPAQSAVEVQPEPEPDPEPVRASAHR
jgi:RND superfamily putative drug exporter